MPNDRIYAFGPFQLDSGRRRLIRDAEPIALSDRQFDILHLLVSRHGQIVSKDLLIETAWRDIAVGDNSLEQAISSLRRLLGSTAETGPFIETVARRGYRFAAPVTHAAPRHSDEALHELLAPYQQFIEGRAAVETLELDDVERACRAFAEVLTDFPDFSPAHIGLANALALRFESTRADPEPDLRSLTDAVDHARDACRLDPESAEAWATLAFALSRAGAVMEAVAAGRRAVVLEPENWRHRVRLAYASWGQERLQAAHEAVKRLPGLALGHWLAATVHVARQALEESLRDLHAGARAQDRQLAGSRFGSVGLHYLLGLVYIARGDDVTGEHHLRHELTFEHSGHVYARQAAANSWYAIGALRLKESRHDEAVVAFECTLERLHQHPMALAALSSIGAAERRNAHHALLDERLRTMERRGSLVESAMARAVADVTAGRHGDAAARIEQMLQHTPTGSAAGWILPVEPLLQPWSHPDEWATVLARLRSLAA